MIVIALSANLDSQFGNPISTFHAAIDHLNDNGVSFVTASDVWLTAPIPYDENQPWYHNAVFSVETDLNPDSLLSVLKDFEKQAGRTETARNASRPLDLDLICYNDVVLQSDLLTVPHPRMHERAFVLLPLQQIEPNWVHPVFKKSISDLIKHMPSGQDLEKLGPLNDAIDQNEKTA